MDSVEVIDLDDPSKTCDIVANYPIATDYVTAQLVDGVVKVCGGLQTELDCYDYNSSSNTWSSSPGPLYEKDYATSSIIDGTWLVTGDDTNPDGTMTEWWTGSQFTMGPTLPKILNRHCQVSINSTHVFFADCIGKETYLLDWESQGITQLDDMTTARSNVCGCGLVQNDQMGKEVVVAGYGTSEIFNFGNMTWRDGPDLPSGYGYASVQLTDTFLMVGGFESSYSNKIYIFDEENYYFTLMPETLAYERRWAGAVAVPDEMFNCS